MNVDAATRKALAKEKEKQAQLKLGEDNEVIFSAFSCLNNIVIFSVLHFCYVYIVQNDRRMS